MTVRELREKLLEIPNQELKVFMFDGDYGDCPIRHVKVREMYNYCVDDYDGVTGVVFERDE